MRQEPVDKVKYYCIHQYWPISVILLWAFMQKWVKVIKNWLMVCKSYCKLLMFATMFPTKDCSCLQNAPQLSTYSFEIYAWNLKNHSKEMVLRISLAIFIHFRNVSVCLSQVAGNKIKITYYRCEKISPLSMRVIYVDYRLIREITCWLMINVKPSIYR